MTRIFTVRADGHDSTKWAVWRTDNDGKPERVHPGHRFDTRGAAEDFRAAFEAQFSEGYIAGAALKKPEGEV